jgi:hypothetical protein
LGGRGVLRGSGGGEEEPGEGQRHREQHPT